MLEIRFTSINDAGPIKSQLDEALSAIGFARESSVERDWNDSTSVASGAVAPASSVLSDIKVEEAPKRRGRPAKDAAPEAVPAVAEKPQISAQPENRVDPAPAAPAPAPEAKPLTKDDVRGVMGRYVQAYGTPAALEDGPKVLGVAKISDLADDQETIKKAIAAAEYALEENPYSRAKVNG